MKVPDAGQQSFLIQLCNSSTPAVQSPTVKSDKQLWKACQSFEALFMGNLVKSMQQTLPEGTLSNSGLPEVMFDQVMGSALSEGGGIGLAELLYRDLQSKALKDTSEDDNGISLHDLLTRGVRKEENDEISSR